MNPIIERLYEEAPRNHVVKPFDHIRRKDTGERMLAMEYPGLVGRDEVIARDLGFQVLTLKGGAK